MQAVSSNYPNATAWNTHGTRAENSDYYSRRPCRRTQEVFDDISQAITSEPPYPTEIHKGYDETKSGYITFTDELGRLYAGRQLHRGRHQRHAIEMTRVTANGKAGDKVGEKSTTIATKVTNENRWHHADQWETYEGYYVIPDGQITTRFGFRPSTTSIPPKATCSTT